MPHGLLRFYESGQSHFITFSCYRRQPDFVNSEIYDLFPRCLEDMRQRFDMRVYGYVVMPEHVHLLLSEPDHGTLAEAIHCLKLSFAKRLCSRRLGVSGSVVSAPEPALSLRRSFGPSVTTETKRVTCLASGELVEGFARLLG